MARHPLDRERWAIPVTMGHTYRLRDGPGALSACRSTRQFPFSTAPCSHAPVHYSAPCQGWANLWAHGKIQKAVWTNLPNSLLSRFDPAQMTPIHIQRFGQLVLGVPVLDTQVLYVRAAALHVIVYLWCLQSQIFRVRNLKSEIMGIGLCMVANGWDTWSQSDYLKYWRFSCALPDKKSGFSTFFMRYFNFRWN